MSLDNFLSLGSDIHYTIWIATFLFLGIASYFDIKERKIPNKSVVTYILIRVCLLHFAPIEANHLLGLVLGYLIIFIPAFIVNKPMGGDMKAMAALGLGVGLYDLLPFVILTLLVSFAYYGQLYLRKKALKDIPFAVFYFIGMILLFALSITL